ncbi:hypothetical protein K3495_g3409 [Podosphaera aphanis]|nr:hypothetical protein K3495_g3409 [Podosphaera aphanis]
MDHQYYVMNGIGPVETGAYKMRGNPSETRYGHHLWRKMDYLWSNAVDLADLASVIRLCRDKNALPDHSDLVTASYVEARAEDAAVKPGVPR